MSRSSRNNNASTRLQQDYLNLKQNPVPYIIAEPLPANILEWRYVIDGPEDTPYFGGVYHGKLIFPPKYPFKPPAILMITPNGKFPVNQRICLTMSDYHPETWKPSWTVGAILTGLLSFMVSKDEYLPSSEFQKKKLARESLEFNLSDKLFCDLFPEKAEKMRKDVEELKQKKLSGEETENIEEKEEEEEKKSGYCNVQ